MCGEGRLAARADTGHVCLTRCTCSPLCSQGARSAELREYRDMQLGVKKRHLVRSRWLARGLMASEGVSTPFSLNP